ncbi:MAG: Phenylalanine-tRNA ligase alpha subunit [candidate division CPR2 bacterium GW2011_GWC1_39_9]|nr:MAG: Phenylalanine-tRNA ligase alpha subunit [candidate division CPR2 bacterium GW2011_GWC1_39_9]
MVDLENLLNKALEKISAATDAFQVEDIRIAYLGRKGEITLAFKELLDLETEEKKVKGQELNTIKNIIEASLEEKTKELLEKERSDLETREWIDVTSPGAKHLTGHSHLVTKTIREMIDIFSRLGFEAVDGPEIETDWYNFEALNMPKGHPVRDTQATFFVDENLVLTGLFFLVFLIAIFMILPVSMFVWERIYWLYFFQFSWRFLILFPAEYARETVVGLASIPVG